VPEPKPTTRALLVAGVLAGAAIGVVDGVRAALAAGLDAGGALKCVAFVAGLDGLVGALAGLGGALLLFAGRWGRARRAPLVAQIAGWAVVGLGAGAAAAGAVADTAIRNNRFLAAGVVMFAAVAVGLAGAVLGPAAGRLLAAGRGRPTESRVTAAGVLLTPLVVLAFAAAVFYSVAHARPPIRRAFLAQLMLLAASAAVLLPFAFDWVSRRPLGRRWAAGFAAVWAAAGVALLAIRWRTDFQYVRWNDVFVLAGIGVGGVVLALRLVTARWQRRAPMIVAGGGALALALLFGAGSSEPARKAAAARAGLAGPFLAGARVALDFDGDGYTRLLGGGDCDDSDPTINPAAQEWPDDGIDQNCDGKDVSGTAVRSLPLHPVPDSIPPDLNLVLVTIDTLRADHLGCYGYKRPTSPELDKLAAEGTLFENGWAHAPSTRYSMPALATSRWNSTIAWEDCYDCRRFWPRIARSQRTLGEALKSLGYLTGAFYAFDYFEPQYRRGFERGIDQYDARRAALHVDPDGDPKDSSGSSSREMADDAIAFFQAHAKDKFFLWMHFYDPHLDYERHPEAPNFGNAPVDLYDGEIWFTDHHFGRVLATLRSLGLWDKTAILVTGDHGEGLGEHGITAHGYHLYGPQTKVPFILRVPGVAPRRVSQPVGHVDVAPTFVNLARGKPEPQFLGRSMLDLALGAPSASNPPRPVLQDFDYEYGGNISGTKRRGLVTATHHLMWNWTPENTTECYDLRADPGENKDLWGSAAGAPCVPLKAELQDLVQVLALPTDLAPKLAFGLARGAPPPAHPMEAKLGSAVRVLGYDLQPDTVRRGGEAELVTHFEVLDRVPAGWRPFFHLDGPAGVRILDHVPVEGVFPADHWRPGQRIRDKLKIPFPPEAPPGGYTVYLGFFKRADRMPISPESATDGQKRLRLATIVVQ
jgi:arylsulfatase A-like enzyme